MGVPKGLLLKDQEVGGSILDVGDLQSGEED
jgi:hypothetical protein